MIGMVGDGLGVSGDVGERRGKVHVLERAPAANLARDLAGQRQDGSAINLRVVQAGEQVRRPGTGDGEAGREFAGELRVGARGEGRGAFVTNPDESQPAGLLGAPQRVAKPRFEWPTMPKTWVTPQFVIVSTMTSDTVRGRVASVGTATYTPSARVSTVKDAGRSVNPGGGEPVSGS